MAERVATTSIDFRIWARNSGGRVYSASRSYYDNPEERSRLRETLGNLRGSYPDVTFWAVRTTDERTITREEWDEA